MRSARWSLVVMMAGLAACGAKSPGQAAVSTAAAGGSKWNTNASAEQVAAEGRGGVDCPAHAAMPAPDPKAPVADVVGVRPGMTYEDAAHIVLCTDPLMVLRPDTSRGFQMKTYGQTIRQGFEARLAEPRVQKSSKQIMQEMQDDALARGGNAVRRDMKPGQSKWYVGTMGVPGHEQVINVAREEWFAAGRNPPMISVEQALLKKYGTPTRNQKAAGRIMISWVYDPLGRPVTETSPLYNRCFGAADPNAGVNLSPDCGVVVAAVVAPLPDNADLSEFMQVGAVDQAGGYQAITATEQTLARLDSQRKARQVEAASKDADAPKL